MLRKKNITWDKTKALIYFKSQSVQVYLSWNSSALHFSLGLGLSLVCENYFVGIKLYINDTNTNT